MSENLSHWVPKENTEYNGWEKRHSRAYVIIYFREDQNNNLLNEYHGGFSILKDKVKIWYMEDGKKLQRFVRRSVCEFNKTISGHTIYYHLIINAKNDGYMNEEKPDKKGKYGLDDREGAPEEKSVIFRVPKEKVGLIGRISGRSSAIYEKKKYEEKLNEEWEEFDSTIEEIKKQNSEFDRLDTTILGLKKSLSVIVDEWHESLISLGNLLDKNKQHEWEMWKTTQESRQIKVQKNSPKIKYSDVDEMNFNSMADFIKQYPEMQAQKTFNEGIRVVEEKRKELINAQQELDKAISAHNNTITKIEDLTDKAQKNLERFEKDIKEGEEKVNNLPYNRSKLFHALKTEYERDATKLDLMRYGGKLEERKMVLEKVKDRLANYQRKKFIDIEH